MKTQLTWISTFVLFCQCDGTVYTRVPLQNTLLFKCDVLHKGSSICKYLIKVLASVPKAKSSLNICNICKGCVI